MNPELDPTHWASDYGDYLYRFTLLRVNDTNQAKDLVQETFVSALKSKDNFKGDSSVKTWLTAILKHKILDFYRKSRRETPMSHLDPNRENHENITQSLFDKNGHWNVEVSDWQSNADQLLIQKDYAKMINICLEKLNPKYRDVFILREMDEVGTDEICQQLKITSSNLWVILHRARLQMQKCLNAVLKK